MCGIAGIYHFNKKPVDRFSIEKMTNCLSHRGPDADGQYVEGAIGIGHRRLSIIDLSPAGNQPFSSANQRYRMVFNGELYNFQDVKKDIHDHIFKSTGDTEVLMEAWVRWGMQGIEKFKGMFSFAIWDIQEQELTICRDRLGVKPLYYYQDADRFIFASEIRSIIASGYVSKRISESALAGYLSFQSVNGEQTILEGVKQLKAGHFLRIKNKEVLEEIFWDITKPRTKYDILDAHSAKKNIRRLLRSAVEQRLVSDVPVGAFLSGGIDSSIIVGLMTEVSSRPPETFNISFQEEAFDESTYAEIIAKKFNTRHHRLLMKPEVMLDSLIPALDAMDTPSGDGVNSYVVSKAIRNAGITVALSGIGGDELFAGYPFFTRYQSIRKFKNIWGASLVLRKLVAMGIGSGNSRKERLQQILSAKSCDIKEFYPIFRRILPPDHLNRLTKIRQGDHNILNEILRNSPAINNFPDLSQVSIAEYLGYTQHTLLKDTDQMSMAVSLEVREPFFDHELVEYVMQIPDSFKQPFYPKKLLVEAMEGLLPDEIVHRKKQGFVFPWKDWMKSELRVFCTENITSISERNFINGENLKNEWRKFLNNDPSVRWMELWLFITLEHWLKKNDAG